VVYEYETVLVTLPELEGIKYAVKTHPRRALTADPVLQQAVGEREASAAEGVGVGGGELHDSGHSGRADCGTLHSVAAAAAL
jgi:hypothetical protein